jgi:hypothetical protein
MSNEFYTEYVIPGNAPVTVATGFSTAPGPITGSCSTLRRTFYVEAGKDYEAFMDIDARYCRLVVQEVNKDGDTSSNIKDVGCR